MVTVETFSSPVLPSSSTRQTLPSSVFSHEGRFSSTVSPEMGSLKALLAPARSSLSRVLNSTSFSSFIWSI